MASTPGSVAALLDEGLHAGGERLVRVVHEHCAGRRSNRFGCSARELPELRMPSDRLRQFRMDSLENLLDKTDEQRILLWWKCMKRKKKNFKKDRRIFYVFFMVVLPRSTFCIVDVSRKCFSSWLIVVKAKPFSKLRIICNHLFFIRW